jgi:hypothetical protein
VPVLSQSSRLAANDDQTLGTYFFLTRVLLATAHQT